MATTDDPLAALATRALDFVRDGVVVGLGSGRAASAFVHALAARVRAGLHVRGVPTSEETARLAGELGISLVGLEAGSRWRSCPSRSRSAGGGSSTSD